jgi:hypothetical protein
VRPTNIIAKIKVSKWKKTKAKANKRNQNASNENEFWPSRNIEKSITICIPRNKMETMINSFEVIKNDNETENKSVKSL